MLRDAPSTRDLSHTAALLYLIGCSVLLIFGSISDLEPNHSWMPGAADLEYERCWKLAGGC